MRSILALLAVQSVASLVLSPVQQFAPPACTRTTAVSMAHHVELKATRKHNKNRPKKSRPSDIYRTPPSYPTLPDIPWMTKLDTVEVMVAPSDTADTLKTKVVAAGAKAPTVFMYQGKAVSGTLADCGLAAATTIKVKKA